MGINFCRYKHVGAAAVAFICFLIPIVSKADADSVNRGSALYYGISLDQRHAIDKNELSAKNFSKIAACVGCHRPSALGGFEGGIAVPPITGQYLFSAFEPLTVNRFPWPTTLRKRPAYSVETLRKTLSSGVTIDGLTISHLMPRYSLSDIEVNDIADFLKNKSIVKSPGLTDKAIRFATITTPDVSEDAKLALIQTLNTFFNDKNAETRLETRRRSTSMLNNETMYVQYRKWELEHWALTGTVDTWQAQLDSFYSKSPVFAIISGLGTMQWQPVDSFCSEKKIPCLFPQTSFAPNEFNFYSLYFDAGVFLQLDWLQKKVSEAYADKKLKYAILNNQTAISKNRAQLVRAHLRGSSNKLDEAEIKEADFLISVESIEDSVRTLQEMQVKPAKVFVLHVDQNMLKMQNLSQKLDTTANDVTWYVIDKFYSPNNASQSLRRAKSWFNSKKFKPANEVVAANALFAATLAVDSLAHADANFSREYCIEKIEHGLENAIPLSSYARLGLSANQRFASKGFGVLTKTSSQSDFSAIWVNP
jgi:hypothetical protein